MHLISKGATSQSIDVFIQDSSSTTGAGKTGLAFNTASLVAYYRRGATGSATAITLATLANAAAAWSSGGFVEIDATNMPGMYRIDVPDAVLASGVNRAVVVLKGASGMAPLTVGIILTSVDLQDAVRGGMTSLPNANAEASGGLPTLSAAQASNGTINANVHRWLTGTPNALQSGRVDGYLGAVASGVIAAASFAANALDAVWSTTTRALTDKAGFALSAAGVQAIWDALTSALTTVGSIGKLLADNINATISSRLASAGYTAPLDAAGTRTALGLASASLDSQLTAIDDFVDGLEASLADATFGLAALETLVDELESRLTATRAGYLDNLSGGAVALQASVDDLEGRLTAALATALQAHSLGIGRGVVDAGATTTAIPIKSMNGAAASATNDQFNGRHVVFTSGTLLLQASSISDYNGTTKTLTVPALTSAPAEDVTFVVV